MRHIKIITLFAFLCVFAIAKAQQSTNELPISFDESMRLSFDSANQIPTITMPQLDMEKIEAEDLNDEKNGCPPNFGYPHKVKYDLNNSGLWYDFSNGDKLWLLNITCPKALSVSIFYDKFWIPKGCKFFVYTKDRKRSLGAFTSKNNKGNRVNPRGFVTGLLPGSEITLEYYQPKGVTEDAIISICNIIHVYRNILTGELPIGSSGTCQVNVNCSEGQNWQNEKKAVACVFNGKTTFTGTLVNTTDQSQKPYLLLADHCLRGAYNQGITYDAIDLPNLDHYLFYWNYETPGCNNSINDLSIYSTAGATVVANNGYSDFALLRLSEDPKEIVGYTPFYMGWDRSGESGDSGVCIHHPMGDVKKISTVLSQPISTSYENLVENENGLFWKVLWNGHGTTEHCSSGAALFNDAHKIIGQLSGGWSNCNNSTSPDWFGKFDVSWTGNGNNSIYRRLDYWLDSLGTGQQIQEGLLVIYTMTTKATNETFYGNMRITSSGQLTIQGNITMQNGSSIVVDAGGCLIIDGGTLSNANVVLSTGASLYIINGGILDPQNDFLAPLGATVNINNGQIL